MSYFWKKIEFYKGKVDDSIHKWDLGQSPGGVSGDKALIFFGFLMSLRQLNGLQCH